MKATTTVILDTRRKKSDETYPLKLRVTFQRKSRFYGVGVDLNKEDFEKLYSPKLRNEDLKEARNTLSSKLNRADEIIKNLKSFSFDNFEKKFNAIDRDKTDVFAALDEYINKLYEDDRAGTAEVYELTRNSIKKFRANLSFSEVTVDFLKSYEKWMIQKGKSLTTVGIYLRSLRAILNKAISEGIMLKEDYPFGNNKYQIPAGRNIKKALTLEQIEKIFNYPTEKGSREDMAKDLWIFTYLSNGINMKDICKLKWKDLNDDKIVFLRAKTINTNRSDSKPIVIILVEETKKIIAKWGTIDKSPKNHIFPFLSPGLSSKEENKIIYNVNKTVNKYMKRIGEELGLNIKLTTYPARHSFSTVLKRSGASIEFISEALGHSSLKTTEYYLDSFEDSTKREFASLLTSFKKK